MQDVTAVSIHNIQMGCAPHAVPLGSGGVPFPRLHSRSDEVLDVDPQGVLPRGTHERVAVEHQLVQARNVQYGQQILLVREVVE